MSVVSFSLQKSVEPNSKGKESKTAKESVKDDAVKEEVIDVDADVEEQQEESDSKKKKGKRNIF